MSTGGALFARQNRIDENRREAKLFSAQRNLTAELDIQVKSDGQCAEHEERQEMKVIGHLLAPSCIGLNGMPLP